MFYRKSLGGLTMFSPTGMPMSMSPTLMPTQTAQSVEPIEAKRHTI